MVIAHIMPSMFAHCHQQIVLCLLAVLRVKGLGVWLDPHILAAQWDNAVIINYILNITANNDG